MKKHHYVIGAGGIIAAIAIVYLLTESNSASAAEVQPTTPKPTLGRLPIISDIAPPVPSSNYQASSGTVQGDPAQIDWILEYYGDNQALADRISDMSADEVNNYYQYLQYLYPGATAPASLMAKIQKQNKFYGINV